MINEILDLSKIETGKIELIIKPINISDLLEECISLIQPLSQVRHIKIINQTQNDKYQVLADAIRLKQVFLNLLSNAVKYNCENGQIILNNIIVYNNFIRIEVTDTGNGLSKQDISKLFRPFERLNQLSHIEGTGIGLVISKNLIDLMGGSIGIHSTLGEGSTFWIELNLYNSHDKINNTMNH
ncbi:MAG: HAMP domain-containing histidine kinase [Gammaproteobacteria bacterium]|nr:HAMP domain-containing histidine kinase [Gammaproteobacteria bacterium]